MKALRRIASRITKSEDLKEVAPAASIQARVYNYCCLFWPFIYLELFRAISKKRSAGVPGPHQTKRRSPRDPRTTEQASSWLLSNGQSIGQYPNNRSRFGR